MKKLFDKFIAQSSPGQMGALAVLFLILALAGAGVGRCFLKKGDPNSAKFGFRETWGLMQCVDGGFVDATISANTKLSPDGKKITKEAPRHVVGLALLFWLGGMVLISFFTGAATNFLDVRREKILSGNVHYSFRRKYILIVGCDFQTGNLIRHLFRENASSRPSIVLVTDTDVGRIYDDLLPELQPCEARKLFIMRKDITLDGSYDKFLITGAEEIYVIGDGGVVGRDGKTLRAFDAVARAAAREMKSDAPRNRRIKAYLHIEDPVLYSSVRAIKLSMDDLKIFDLDVFNYYESWAWECWSNKDSADGKDAYLPIRHENGTTRAELFVIGAGRMGLALVNFAMPLMNYGADGKHGKITVFDLDGSKRGLLPDRKTLDALPELEVEFRQLDGCSEEANAVILEAAGREDTSVTVVIAVSDPVSALQIYAGFSKRLCREKISVLIWQATDSECVPAKSYLRMGGADSEADGRIVRYFGMTDRLPWKNPARADYGMAVNYYYACWFPWGKEAPESAAATAPDFVEKARAMWDPARPGESEFNGTVAGTEWSNTARWKKWSSINCGDTFREKAVLLEGVPYAEAAEKILKAEHNRWWTEKILGGWLPSEQKSADAASHADKKKMIHGDMIPFEELPDEVRDKDKINIAAMAAYGFLK
ncbi:MAG: hypothetical protein IJT50_00140 [Lentisphaeria bacterium]|nr:hypothetical protein [Lentisphaeria bacterium]